MSAAHLLNLAATIISTIFLNNSMRIVLNKDIVFMICGYRIRNNTTPMAFHVPQPNPFL